MNTTQLLQETLRTVVALYDLPDVAIRVCGKDFYIIQAILPLIWGQFEQYLAKTDTPFIVSLTDDDHLHSFFENVTPLSMLATVPFLCHWLKKWQFLI
jgi:hypothetical protein